MLGRFKSVSPAAGTGGRAAGGTALAWTAQCPCPDHGDEEGVLDIGLDADGKVVLICHGECELIDILQSVGLRESDLLPVEPPSLPVGPAPLARSSGLLRSEEVRDAIRTGTPILLLDGEEAAESALHLAGGAAGGPTPRPFCPTTPPRGLGRWLARHRDELCNARVWLVPGDPGPELGRSSRVASDLFGIAKSVQIVRLPFPHDGSPHEGGTLSDWVALGGTASDLQLIAETAPFVYHADPAVPTVDISEAFSFAPTHPGSPLNARTRGANPTSKVSVFPLSSPAGDGHTLSPSQALPRNEMGLSGEARLPDLLSWFGRVGISALRPSDGALYVRAPSAAPLPDSTASTPPPTRSTYAYPVDDPLLYSTLGAAFHRDTGSYARRSDLTDACALLGAELGASASPPGEPVVLARRIGFSDGTLYVDFFDDAGTVLAVDSSGWSPVDRCPVTFVRTSTMLPLPRPCSGGAIELLRDLLRLTPGPTWVAVRSWLVGTLLPYGPVPPLLLRERDPIRTTHLVHLLSWVLDPYRRRPPHTSPQAPTYARPHILRSDLYDGAHAHLSALDELGRFDHPRGGRLILTDRSRVGYSSELRRRCLVLDPDFAPWGGPRSTLPSQVASVHGAILGAVFDAAAEAIRGYAGSTPPADLLTSGYAPFLRWVTAAEAAMAPASVTFQELWDDATGRTPAFLRLWRSTYRRACSVWQRGSEDDPDAGRR